MKRKLLVVAGLLGISLMGRFAQPALGTQFCSYTYCSANPDAVCQCPPGTLAFQNGGVADCYTWHADCNYL